MNITAYSVIFIDTSLIREIKMQKSYFEAFRGNLVVPLKFQIIRYVTVHAYKLQNCQQFTFMPR